MVRHYVPTGRPRGRPRKITTPLIPKIGTPNIPKIDPKKTVGEEPLKELGELPSTTTTIPVIVSQHQTPQQQQQQQPTNETDETENLIDHAFDDIDKLLPQVIARLLPTVEPHTQADLCKVIAGVSAGDLWRNVVKASGMQYRQVSGYRRRCKGFCQLFTAAQALGNEERQFRREEAIYKRGVTGWTEKVWNLKTGELLGRRRLFSDRLCELGAKAADPQKYGEKHQLDIKRDAPAVVIYQIEGVTLGQQPPPTDWSKVVDIPPDSATKTLPGKPEASKPL